MNKKEDSRRYQFCNICIHSSFDSKLGKVCKLTGDKPAFINTCTNFTTKNNNQEECKDSILADNRKKDLKETRRKRIEIRISIISIILITIAYLSYDFYGKKVLYSDYFHEYNRTIAITKDISYPRNSVGWSIGYLYKVGTKIYKGSYYVAGEGEPSTKYPFGYPIINYPNGKYIVIYSVKDPRYHVFIPQSVRNKTDLMNVKITENEIKDNFSIYDKGKFVKDLRK